jgi:hypothetical protein
MDYNYFNYYLDEQLYSKNIYPNSNHTPIFYISNK